MPLVDDNERRVNFSIRLTPKEYEDLLQASKIQRRVYDDQAAYYVVMATRTDIQFYRATEEDRRLEEREKEKEIMQGIPQQPSYPSPPWIPEHPDRWKQKPEIDKVRISPVLHIDPEVYKTIVDKVNNGIRANVAEAIERIINNSPNI